MSKKIIVKQFNLENSEISYRKWGDGEKAIIAFHGFGDSAKLYDEFYDCYAHRANFYAIDLPFHGNTKWTHKTEYNINDIYNIIKRLCLLEKIRTFTILAYSMSGKILMCVYPLIANFVQEIILISSDGLKGTSLRRKILPKSYVVKFAEYSFRSSWHYKEIFFV